MYKSLVVGLWFTNGLHEAENTFTVERARMQPAWRVSGAYVTLNVTRYKEQVPVSFSDFVSWGNRERLTDFLQLINIAPLYCSSKWP